MADEFCQAAVSTIIIELARPFTANVDVHFFCLAFYHGVNLRGSLNT